MVIIGTLELYLFIHLELYLRLDMLGMRVLQILRLCLTSLGTAEGVYVWKVALIAGQELSTWSNQFWCEGELLAVEDEHVACFMYVMIALSALGQGLGCKVDDPEHF